MNQAFFLWLNNFVGQSVVFDTLALFAARDLIYIMLAGFLGVIWRSRPTGRPRVFVAAVLCGVIALQIILLVHQSYPNPRPQATDLPVKALITYTNDYSFPSLHTTFAFFLAMLVFSLRPRLGIAYFAGATIIGLFRVVAGVHWPLDILAGAVLGIANGWVGRLLLYE